MGYTVPLRDAIGWDPERRDALCREFCAIMRPADRAEIQAIVGQAPEEFLPVYLQYIVDPLRDFELAFPERRPVLTSYAFVMYSDEGELAGLCGIDADYGCDGLGRIWMLGTEVLDRKPVEFLRASKAWLGDQKPMWHAIANHVDARNAKHIEWLRWLGFEIDDVPEPYGVEGRPFHKFRLIPSKSEPCALQLSPP